MVKHDSIFQTKENLLRIASFYFFFFFLQINLISGLTEDSWILISALHSICCDVLCWNIWREHDFQLEEGRPHRCPENCRPDDESMPTIHHSLCNSNPGFHALTSAKHYWWALKWAVLHWNAVLINSGYTFLSMMLISSISRDWGRISKCLILCWYSKHFLSAHFCPLSLLPCDGSFYAFISLGHGMPSNPVKQYLRRRPWGSFQKRLTAESVSWVKQMVLPSVGGPRPTHRPAEGPNRTESEKSLNFLSLFHYLSWDMNLLLPLD